MAQAIVDLLMFTVILFSAWYFFYFAVPQFGKRAALCLLHNARDELYKIKGSSAVGNNSLVYEDVIFSLTSLVHFVRDEPPRVTVPLVIKIVTPSKSMPTANCNWRLRRYDYEMREYFSNKDGSREIQHAGRIYFKKDVALAIYLCTLHPILFIMGIVTSIAFLAIYVYRRYTLSAVKSVTNTIETLRAYETDAHLIPVVA